MATLRSVSCGRPSADRSADADSVNTVKLATRPAMIAYGRRRPPAAPPASTIGSTGSTQGDTAAMTPATKPIASSRSSPPTDWCFGAVVTAAPPPPWSEGVVEPRLAP